MSEPLSYEVVVIGGGPAGMTTALYTTRLGHRTAVFEAAGGRHASVANVHNLFGVSEDVSGEALAKHAVAQFEEYGGTYFFDEVTEVRRGPARGEDAGGDPTEDADSDPSGRFVVDADHATVAADRVVFATGFRDANPDVPGIERFTGRGLHYCLHCDAYALGDGPVFVLGRDDHAAEVAMLMLNVTADVDLLLDGQAPTWSPETERQLRAHPVDRIDEEVVGAFARGEDSQAERREVGHFGESYADGDEPWLGGLRFADEEGDLADEGGDLAGEGGDQGTDRAYLGGFAVYGKEYETDLAASLGCDLADDGALAVDEDFETSVDGAYAVGDVTHGQNQTVVALGDGAKAGIAIHKDLRRFPVPTAELDGDGDAGNAIDESDVPAAAADLRAKMRLVRNRDRHAGLRDPPPER